MPEPLRTCLVGDSLVLGVGDREGLGWAGRLVAAERRRGLDITGYNLGVRRETSFDVERRWAAEVAPRLPAAAGYRRAVVFAFGTNDCLIEDSRRRVELDASIGAASRIFRSAAAQAPVLFVGPPPTADDDENRRIGELSARFADVAAEQRVPFFSLFALLERDSGWREQLRSGDGYHPAAEGYATIAARLAEWSAWRLLIGAERRPSVKGRPGSAEITRV